MFVKTLLGAVALNNMACIFLFEVARLIAHEVLGASDMGVWQIVWGAASQFSWRR